MKKTFLTFIAFAVCSTVWGATLPDNMYFNAMKDEMMRTMKELRVKGSPNPLFVAYKLTRLQATDARASFGDIYSRDTPQDMLEGTAVVDAGTPQSDSLGFESDRFYYRPTRTFRVPQSYDGIRQAFWEATDREYIQASDAYEKKQAYKRQKNLTGQKGDDFSFARPASFADDVLLWTEPDMDKMERLVQTISARGKGVSYLEDFSAEISIGRIDSYYLNSEGGFYQKSEPYGRLELSARLRNKDGHKESLMEEIRFKDAVSPDEKELLEKTDAFLAALSGVREAKKAEPYLGPVLLKPQASAGFLSALFVRNMHNIKPLLSAQQENDPSAGLFRDKQGMRVMSNVLDVYDRPLLREYKGTPLDGFTPVDDEGVLSSDLTLVSGGRLQELPLSRRPAKEGNKSNGHARMGWGSYPRETLTNVFFEAKNPLGEEDLEAKLLSRCRELELEYCYILTRFPKVGDSAQTGAVSMAQRIYTQDGRKETVYGVKIAGLTTRSLRDILAAGADEKVSSIYAESGAKLSLIAPSLLVDELEILPDEKKADRKPFIPKP